MTSRYFWAIGKDSDVIVLPAQLSTTSSTDLFTRWLPCCVDPQMRVE